MRNRVMRVIVAIGSVAAMALAGGASLKGF
jgi:hypothetical protein